MKNHIANCSQASALVTAIIQGDPCLLGAALCKYQILRHIEDYTCLFILRQFSSDNRDTCQESVLLPALSYVTYPDQISTNLRFSFCGVFLLLQRQILL